MIGPGIRTGLKLRPGYQLEYGGSCSMFQLQALGTLAGISSVESDILFSSSIANPAAVGDNRVRGGSTGFKFNGIIKYCLTNGPL